MKLARILHKGEIIPIIKVDDKLIDLREQVKDFDSSFFEEKFDTIKKTVSQYSNFLQEDIGSLHFLSPVSNPSKIVCIGLNYASHAKEMNMPLPKEPVIFQKAISALTRPSGILELPPIGDKVDWEAELAIVIKKKAKNVTRQEAESYIAGYTIMNDISERKMQLEMGGLWTKGKSYDHFAPLGPWLVPPEHIGNVEQLSIKTIVNGIIKQDGNTSQMIFPPTMLVSYVSQFMTLSAGDIISTGTPEGAGLQTDGPYLKDGDRMEVSISELGTQKMKVLKK